LLLFSLRYRNEAKKKEVRATDALYFSVSDLAGLLFQWLNLHLAEYISKWIELVLVFLVSFFLFLFTTVSGFAPEQ
jgi:hypothetical protein